MARQSESNTPSQGVASTTLDLQQARDSVQRNIPEKWLPGVVLLCSADPHSHGALDKETGRRVPKPCATPGKRPIEAAWNRLAAHRWADSFSAVGVSYDTIARRLAAHVSKGGNLGMCPPPGVVILDADSEDAVELLDSRCAPGTPVMSRANDSAHFYVRYDPKDLPLKAKQTKWGDETRSYVVDLRTPARAVKDKEKAGGAQTALPPSRHKSGVRYAWAVGLPEDPADVPAMPYELVEIFRTFHKADIKPAAVTSELPGHDRIRGYINRWCRYVKTIEEVREKAFPFAKKVYADRLGRYDQAAEEGGEIDRLIESGWAMFGGASPLEEDKTDQAYVDLFLMSHQDWRYNADDNRWVMWTGCAWQKIPTEFIRHEIGKLSHTLFEDAAEEVADGQRRERLTIMSKGLRSAAKVTQVLRRLQDQLALKSEAFDANPHLMTFPAHDVYPAVTLDLMTGVVKAPERDDLITRVAGGPYIIGAWRDICPELGKFMDLTFPERELLAFVMRCMGFTTLGETLEHVFLFLYGHAGTGKSTFLNAFSDALGDYAISTPFEIFTGKTGSGPNTHVASWKGCRMVVCSEIPKDTKLGAAMKDYTGGDKIATHHKFGHAFTFKPQHTVWVAGNDQPKSDHMDSGIERRLRCIPADQVVPKGKIDKRLPIKLSQPLAVAAMLSMALQGLRMYQADGIGSCGAVEVASKAYWREMNPVSGWVEECCETGPGKVALNEARALYEGWLVDHFGIAKSGKMRLGKKQFREAIERLDLTVVLDRKQKVWVHGLLIRGSAGNGGSVGDLGEVGKLPDIER